MLWVWLTLGSVVCLAAYDLITKRTVGREHSVEYLTLYGLCSLALSVPLAFTVPMGGSALMLVIMAASSAVNAACMVLVTRAYRHLPVSEVAPLSNLQILVVVAGAAMFFGEPLTSRLLLGALLIMGGAWLLATVHGPGEPVPGARRHYWIVGALGFALAGVTALSDRLILSPSVMGLAEPGVEPAAWLVWSRGFTAAFLLGWMRLRYGGWSALATGWRAQGRWVALAAAVMIVGIFAYLQAVARAPVGPIVVVLKLEPLLVTLVGGSLFHEHRLNQKMMAGTLMLGGVAVLAL